MAGVFRVEKKVIKIANGSMCGEITKQFYIDYLKHAIK